MVIGGMICVFCINGIMEGLKKLDWIDDVVVNLFFNSVMVKFYG